jgi:hypothetical protein
MRRKRAVVTAYSYDYTQYVSICAENAGILYEVFGVILPIDVKKKEEERETSVVKEVCRGGNDRGAATKSVQKREAKKMQEG